jgi:hypothetical protein
LRETYGDIDVIVKPKVMFYSYKIDSHILETNGAITSKSIIRSSILFAFGEDPKKRCPKEIPNPPLPY